MNAESTSSLIGDDGRRRDGQLNNYGEQGVRLQPGNLLVLYSDGSAAARNADGEHFGTRRARNTCEYGSA
jgi:hypothetical protein